MTIDPQTVVPRWQKAIKEAGDAAVIRPVSKRLAQAVLEEILTRDRQIAVLERIVSDKVQEWREYMKSVEDVIAIINDFKSKTGYDSLFDMLPFNRHMGDGVFYLGQARLLVGRMGGNHLFERARYTDITLQLFIDEQWHLIDIPVSLLHDALQHGYATCIFHDSPSIVSAKMTLDGGCAIWQTECEDGAISEHITITPDELHRLTQATKSLLLANAPDVNHVFSLYLVGYDSLTEGQ